MPTRVLLLERIAHKATLVLDSFHLRIIMKPQIPGYATFSLRKEKAVNQDSAIACFMTMREQAIHLEERSSTYSPFLAISKVLQSRDSQTWTTSFADDTSCTATSKVHHPRNELFPPSPCVRHETCSS